MKLATDAFHAQFSAGKINQQRVRQTKRFEVRAKHSEMNVLNADDRLQLDDDAILDEQIHPVLANRITAIKNRNRLLSFERKPYMPQLNSERFFIDRLKKARPEFAPNSNRAANNALRQFLVSKLISWLPGFQIHL